MRYDARRFRRLPRPSGSFRRIAHIVDRFTKRFRAAAGLFWSR
jgi:hypothetical protein